MKKCAKQINRKSGLMCDCKKYVKNFCEVKINKNMEERERIVRKFINFLTPYWIITIFLGALVNSGKFYSLFEYIFKSFIVYWRDI